MSYRFNSMIAILRNSIKTHKKDCSIPGNKHCFRLLNLLRSQGLILGFHMKPKESRPWDGYPRYNIMIKYYNFQMSVIKKMKVYKNTRTNFQFFNANKKILDPIKKKRIYVVNSKKGLTFLSIENFLLLYKLNKFRGKIVLEINV